MLRPYGSRNAHLGSDPALPQEHTEIFNLENCKVAQYLISEFGNSLTFKNGRPTKLYLHASTCEDCISAAPLNVQVERIEPLHTIEFRSKELLRRFRQWKQKNHPSETDESAIKLLCDYYDYAYHIIRPEWIAYKNRFGELKK